MNLNEILDRFVDDELTICDECGRGVLYSESSACEECGCRVCLCCEEYFDDEIVCPACLDDLSNIRDLEEQIDF